MAQNFINKHFYNLLIFTLTFGVLLYDTLGFNYTDEICALLLAVLWGFYVFHTPEWKVNKFFLSTIGVFLFYLVYSFIIKSNVKPAIIMDFLIQIKPFLGFFCVYSIMPVLDKNQKKIMQYIVLLFSFYLLVIGLLDLFVQRWHYIRLFMFHPSRYATAISILALLYLYCSNNTTKDKLVCIAILTIGLISTRSKFFGFYALCIFILFYVREGVKLKFNIKTAGYILLAVGFVVLVAKEKINFYFFQHEMMSGNENDLFARLALYLFSIPIFMDYFPFGSGFASYATYTSGLYYSKIYNQYHMDKIWGLTKDNSDFIADTYYPALAQFGVVGVVLFFLFWIILLKKAIRTFNSHTYLTKELTLAVLIICFFLIESTSDATITHNRGIFMMMLMGMVFSDMKRMTTQEKVSNHLDENSQQSL